jgi:hypothetical protein
MILFLNLKIFLILKKMNNLDTNSNQEENSVNNKISNTINNRNDDNMRIINNSDNCEEVNDTKSNQHNNTNFNYNQNSNSNNSNNETGSNNDNDNDNQDESNNEENEDNSEETDLEREAALLLNKQYEQIKQLKEELLIKNSEINNLNQIIGEMNLKLQECEENVHIFNELKNQIDILNHEKRELKIELNGKEQLIFELKSDLNTLSKKFNDLNNNLNSLSKDENTEKKNKIIILNKKHSKEIKIYEDKINLYEKEIFRLNQTLKNEMRLKQKLELSYNEKIKEEKKWISQVNQDIQLICQWINNYMGVYFDKNIEIPEVPYISAPISSESVLVYNKFDFEKLRREIYEARKKVWDKQVGYETSIENLKKEQIDFIDKVNKLNKDITGLNNENLMLKEELNKRNINLDILQSQINKYNI